MQKITAALFTAVLCLVSSTAFAQFGGTNPDDWAGPYELKMPDIWDWEIFPTREDGVTITTPQGNFNIHGNIRIHVMSKNRLGISFPTGNTMWRVSCYHPEGYLMTLDGLRPNLGHLPDGRDADGNPEFKEVYPYLDFKKGRKITSYTLDIVPLKEEKAAPEPPKEEAPKKAKPKKTAPSGEPVASQS